MFKIRKILKPISMLYGEVMSIRNKMYDKGRLKSTKFETPTIVVGNLSVGGTGKSPMIEYLVRLLKKDYKIAVLSRGYKRTTKGFQIATNISTAAQIGDEPLQFYKKFKDIIVAVDAKRVNGIEQLKNLENPPEIILLDDAFQHRKVSAGYYILLTPYDNLYVDDSMLPSGYLRENIEGAKRAQIIIVSKCPDNLSNKEQFEITKRLAVDLKQTVYFTKIDYATEVISKQQNIKVDHLKDYKILVVTGIAKTKPLTTFLTSKKISFIHLKFKDHYQFKQNDLDKIEQRYSKINTAKKIILTTEKDYVRTFENSKIVIYYLPIKTQFLDFKDSFNTKIQRYVEQSTRNG
ncbi:MAG: tetraacyldisaccharide 4'-kinase [Flavobacteriaceae bacterium]|nr:tetraacyldisaccharide 4'-kinase [Flavobacteriaceae bacterium]